MAIYSFSNFGYDGLIVNVEVDLRRGIPAVDIVGLADGAVKETRERVRAAIRNSGFEFPTERVLISLSPADLKKEGAGFDLPIALAILSAKDDYPRSQDAKVMVMGELELSGKLRPVRGVYPALVSAVENGIRYAIVPQGAETAVPEGIDVRYAETLEDAYYELARIDEYEIYSDDFEEDEQKNEKKKSEFKVEFNELKTGEDNLDSVEGHNGLKYTMAVAVAGGHHMMVYGKPGCGKTMVLQHLPELMPKLLDEESKSTTRIHSIAGLLNPNEGFKTIRPFRMPHQTASIEGMCGGGANVRPGEISLAHNGVLFLDEAAEFRSSVLQMLRIPLESNSITISRAGRSTVYPAKFQLVMATNPCPCGNYGSKDKICLCSAKSIEMYWKKFAAPLLDRVGIRFDCNAEDYTDDELFSLKKLRELIEIAWKVQYKRQGKLNQDLTVAEVSSLKLTNFAKEALDEATERYGYSPREISNILKIARTVQDMCGIDDRASPEVDDIAMNSAIKYHGKLPIDFE